MRALVHILAILLALPQLLVCAFIGLASHVGAVRAPASLLTRSVDAVYIVFTWGGLAAAVVLVALAAAGFNGRTRRAAALILAALVIASTAMLIGWAGAGNAAVASWLFLPGLFALVMSVALAADQRGTSSSRQSARHLSV